MQKTIPNNQNVSFRQELNIYFESNLLIYYNPTFKIKTSFNKKSFQNTTLNIFFYYFHFSKKFNSANKTCYQELQPFASNKTSGPNKKLSVKG